ncbi:comF family protein [Kaistia soli DSM 19436]|uniref:ComF family protein n=1 Tax=Kaistia soli DSM 19436 TaxID=1122133 RepID=A0A1M5N1G5_9HYPH|nr:ComF family protein [Kaistia soli]SHG83398.1 comF family protein [Kaistia soli DSM 19436]
MESADLIEGDETGTSAAGPRRLRLFTRALDLVLPPACMACGKPVATSGALCSPCWGVIRWIERPFCERLAIPFGYDIGPGALSAEAIAHPPPFGRLRAVCLYGAEAGHIVQALKYGDRTELAKPIGAMMARALGPIADEVDVVLPVPLHRRRLWQRRFNQSALISEALASVIHRPYEPALIARIRPTRQQVGLKANERAKNVEGAFRVPSALAPALKGRRVLLVDDVYTTGATVKAVTRALLRGGAKSVDVAVFARVVEGIS